MKIVKFGSLLVRLWHLASRFAVLTNETRWSSAHFRFQRYVMKHYYIAKYYNKRVDAYLSSSANDFKINIILSAIKILNLVFFFFAHNQRSLSNVCSTFSEVMNECLTVKDRLKPEDGIVHCPALQRCLCGYTMQKQRSAYFWTASFQRRTSFDFITWWRGIKEFFLCSSIVH